MQELIGADAEARVLLLEDLGAASDMLNVYRGVRVNAVERQALSGWLGVLHAMPVPEPDPLTSTRDRLTRPLTIPLTSAFASGVVVANDGVERSDLVAGVGDDETTGAREGGRAFDLGRMEDDLSPFDELVEHLTTLLTDAHEKAEPGVDGVGEPVHGSELEPGLIGCPAGG